LVLAIYGFSVDAIMSTPDPAIPTRISSINKVLSSQKLRIAGRLLSYDDKSGLILVMDGHEAVLVDVSLCVGRWSSDWIREYLSQIMVVGYLDKSVEALPIPTIPKYIPAPVVDPMLVIRALFVVEARELDMDAWNAGIEAVKHTQNDINS